MEYIHRVHTNIQYMHTYTYTSCVWCCVNGTLSLFEFGARDRRTFGLRGSMVGEEHPGVGEEPTHQPSVAILAQVQQGGCRLTLLHGKRDHVHLLIQISPRRVSLRDDGGSHDDEAAMAPSGTSRGQSTQAGAGAWHGGGGLP